MDALDQLTNMYGSSAGSGGFNRPPNPSMTRFDDHEGGDILKVYGGRGQQDMGFGYQSPMRDGDFMDDYSHDDNPHFGIERQRHNYEKATNFINNDMQRPYTGGGYMRDDTASFDKYSARGRGGENEGFEDILDSLKGDVYDRRDMPPRHRGPPAMERPYTGPAQYTGAFGNPDRRNTGPISVEARSIPDLDRSHVSSRDDDLRSIQPQNLGRGDAPIWAKAGSFGNRGVSTGEEKRRSKYRNDPSPVGGGIDIIDTPASRRTKTADPKNARKDKVDIPRFYGKFAAVLSK